MMIKLYHGKNTFLSKRKADEAVTELRKLCNSNDTSYQERTFDASSASAEDIIAEIETPSLFSPHKILFIKRLNKNPDKENIHTCVVSLLDQDQNSPDLDIIIWEDEKLRSNLRFVKSLKEHDAIDESPEFNKRTFQTWGKEQAELKGLSLSRDATHLLSERTNFDPERFTRELTKLSLLGKEELSEDDIENLCPDTLEHTIWELIDAINANDAHLAEQRLDRVLRQGNDPIYVLLMIARNVRIVLLTKLLLQKGASTYDIARKIKAPPFTINAIKRNAQETSMERIVLLYDKLSNIDYSGKTGQLDIALALNILLSVI